MSLLLVDDRPANLVTLEAVLEGLGADLVRANSGKEALEQVREQEFAAILLDVQMPEMDGFETARRIREIEGARLTPIIFLTAIHRSPEYESRGYALGAVDYLAKPFDPDALRSKVAALIGLARRSQQAQALVSARDATILKAAQDAVVTLDAANCIVEWNPAAERIFGYSREQAVGRELCELLVPPARSDDGQTALECHLAAGQGLMQGQRLELTVFHADGRQVPVELTVFPVPQVEPALSLACLRDLTEPKRHEARLRTQFEVTQVLAESPGLAEAVPSLMRVICRNKGWDWAAYWEGDPQSERLRLIDCFPCHHAGEPDLAGLSAEISFTREAGLPGRVWAGGEPIWVSDIDREPNFPRAESARKSGFCSALAFPIRSDGTVLGVMELFSRDRRAADPEALQLVEALGSQIGQFIQRKRAEEALRRREERLRHLQSVTDAALVHLPLDELLNTLLERVCAALHTDEATVLLLEEGELAVRASQGLEAEVEHAVRVPLGHGFAARIAAARQPRILEDVADGNVYSPQLRAAGIRSLLGVPLQVQDEVIGVLHVGTRQPRRFSEDDVALLELVADRVALAADRARLVATLEEESARKSDFLSVVAHELRTPLSAISNALYVLENSELGDARAARQVEIGGRQARQLARLVDDLMDIGRIAKGKVELRREPVAIGPIAREAADAVRPLADGRGQEFHCDFPTETLVVQGDPGRLEQVVTNLLQNAVKYTDPGGTILLSLRRQDENAVLQVRDTGIGIDPPMLSQIFEMFHQIEEDGTRARGGMGIGLALTKRLVELHGGTIDVASEGRGKGTVFTVRLPLLERTPASEAADPPASAGKP